MAISTTGVKRNNDWRVEIIQGNSIQELRFQTPVV